MTTTTDSNNVKLASSHKKSLTELSINDDNHINYNTDSNINDDQEKSKPLKKRKKNDLSRKRKSEAAIHINTSRLFPSQINGHNNKRNNNHSKKTYRHSHSQNNNQVQHICIY